MDILEEIVRDKRAEVSARKAVLPLGELKSRVEGAASRPVRSMKGAILASPCGIIAEFKRRSPSKGWLHPDARVEDIVPAYERGGAAACSILTDTKYFGGTAGDLTRARGLVSLPLLRKDFIIDPYQVYEARLLGADAILLIAAALEPRECSALARLARQLGLEVLLEIHRPEELPYLCPEVDMLGVNNRNLGTFHTSVGNSLAIAAEVRSYLVRHPERHTNPLLVSESGIGSAGMLHILRGNGFRGFLIGESFMKAGDPGEALRDYAREGSFIYKVCGMREPGNVREVVSAGANTIGLVFYPRSPRCVREEDGEALAGYLRGAAFRKVGVFVDDEPSRIVAMAERYGLTHIQLHGSESPGYCQALRGSVPSRIIKALPVSSQEGLPEAGAYDGVADYILFDTKTPAYGGSGQCFDWRLLAGYTRTVPFILSGGLSVASAAALKPFRHPCWAGIDMNSGVEVAPGIKDPRGVRAIIDTVYNIIQPK